ncbi:alpha/beta fold hydrolase [Pseudomonas palleroniana]|uniref:alpha/beta fold hydrolase n=1 Tax=Pseudomonas palleroniana TaxID=191390 RepID=UPI001FD2211E|nr:alpha/beta fold hydrolase [Pseudomonas palleroniana]UOP10330.1 alpha/beta hydrolase [Pseudomonas palleroniana]
MLIGDTQVGIYGSGPTLVMCHGFTTTAQFWREQIGTFSQTHRVVVLDLPGHGRSPRPADRKYTIDAFVTDLELIFKTLTITDAVLIGLSMGGTVSQHFALKNPELLKALVLVGATPHGLGPAVQVNNVLEAIERLGVEQSSQDVIDRSFAPGTCTELLAFAKREVINTPDFVAREAIVSLNEADSRPLLTKLKMPTLVICGEEDQITPPDQSSSLATGIPNATLELLKRAGHFPMLEQPERFNAVLCAFLDRISA